MKRTFTKLVSFLVVISMLLALGGCYGSFNLTKKVWKFNGELGGKWVNELGFLVMNIVPVYGAAAFVDAVVLNTIEFWTGSNPLADNAIETIKTEDGTAQVTFDRANKVVTIEKTVAGKGVMTYRIVRENGDLVVRDANNHILVRSQTMSDGTMVLRDESGVQLASYTPAEVAAVF